MEFTNQYLTYVEYKKLGGALDEPPFNEAEYKVQKIIDRHTFGRLMNLSEQKEEVKRCIYELMKEGTAIQNNSANKNISSETIDGYSVTYSTFDENVLKANMEKIRGIIRNYLCECYTEDGTPYIFRGVGKNVK